MEYAWRKTLLRQFSWYTFLLVAAVLITSGLSASAESASQARQEIQAILAKRALARQKKNLNDYMATFSPDWTTTNVSGRVVNYNTLKQSVGGEILKTPVPGVIRSNIIKITTLGNSAKVTVDTYFDYPPYKSPGGLVYYYKDTVASETWIKGRTGWQEKQERYLVDTATVSASPLTASERHLPQQ